jgi:hypothetical protein
MTTREQFSFVEVSHLRLRVGNIDDLLDKMGEDDIPDALVLLDDQQSPRAFYVLTQSEAWALNSLDPEARRAAFGRLPKTLKINTGQTSRARAVVLDTDGNLRGAWLPTVLQTEQQEVHGVEVDDFSDGSANVDAHIDPVGPGGDVIGFSIGTAGEVYAGGYDGQRAVPPHPASLESGPPKSSPRDVGDPTLRRTPHLDTPSTIPTAPGTEFSVSIYTDDQPFDADETGSDVSIDAPPEVKRIRLTVTLIVSEHFEVRGAASRGFDIKRDQPRSRPVTFRLQVAKKPPSTRAVITALFSYGGRVCGTVAKQWNWDPSRPTPQHLTPETPVTPTTLIVFTGAPRADLSVFVTASGDGLHFTSIVQTNLIPGYARPTPAPWSLPELAAQMVSSKLDALIDSRTSSDERLDALKRSGYEFWDAAPANFKEAFWQIIDSGRPLKSIYIASAEPSIPWELMIPFRPGGPQPDRLPPLGVTYAIGRWCRNTENLTAASPSLPVRDAFVVVPRYRTLQALDARDEVKLIRTRMRGRRVQRASRQAFDRYFLRHRASLLHFVCHGASGIDNDDVLYLDADEMLRSGSLRSNDGLRAMCRARAPFVFINACSTGQRVPGLVGGAGFPLAFGDIGARAILAPLWPVESAAASRIAVELYQTALQPGSPPVAEILRKMRIRAYGEQDADSYAAYAFFGDPTARLELVS